jgi:hypothetical protein
MIEAPLLMTDQQLAGVLKAFVNELEARQRHPATCHSKGSPRSGGGRRRPTPYGRAQYLGVHFGVPAELDRGLASYGGKARLRKDRGMSLATSVKKDRFASAAKEAAAERAIQEQIDRKEKARLREGKKRKGAMQAGARRYPEPPFPNQHQTKPDGSPISSPSRCTTPRITKVPKS